jgi:DNA polymerase-4
VGVRATGLRPASGAAVQMSFDDRPVGWREAEQAMDRIAGKFGTDTIQPGTLLRVAKPHQPGNEFT